MSNLAINFKLISPGGSFQSLLRRASNEVLNPPILPNDEPKGFLSTQTGQNAYIEFLTAGDYLASGAELGSNYEGPGIYLLDYYKGEPKEDIPFYVVVEENKLTVGDTQEILKTIDRIISSNEHLNSSSWTLDGKKNSLNPLSSEFRKQYLNN